MDNIRLVGIVVERLNDDKNRVGKTPFDETRRRHIRLLRGKDDGRVVVKWRRGFPKMTPDDTILPQDNLTREREIRPHHGTSQYEYCQLKRVILLFHHVKGDGVDEHHQ